MSKRRCLNKLFKQFHKNLQIPNEDRSTLQMARKDVRAHLRRGFARIKFMTQGSFAYHTLIRPNITPPQRMDLDDGAYFSGIEITQENAAEVSKKLFYEVDSTLMKLANQKNWHLDTSKPTCCRLVISMDKHIDIPCYIMLTEKLEEKIDLEHRSSFSPLYEDAGIPYYPFMPSGFILLAHREKGWIESDPRQIIDWVLKCTAEYGEQFLRVCCYFKAWRDNQWESSSMKSLLLMAMIRRAYADERILRNKIEDDEVVFKASGRMIDYLESDNCTKDPSDNSKCLDENLTLREREMIIEKIRVLHKDLEAALYGESISKDKACELMDKQFGKWFPRDSSLIFSLAAPVVVTAPTKTKASPGWAE